MLNESISALENSSQGPLDLLEYFYSSYLRVTPEEIGDFEVDQYGGESTTKQLKEGWEVFCNKNNMMYQKHQL